MLVWLGRARSGTEGSNSHVPSVPVPSPSVATTHSMHATRWLVLVLIRIRCLINHAHQPTHERRPNHNQAARIHSWLGRCRFPRTLEVLI